MSDSAGDDDEVEIIANPNPIAKKAKAVFGKSADEMLQVAAEKINNLQGEFTAILRQDVEKIQGLFRSAETDLAGRNGHIDAIRRLSHELRGQGGTFGYPLVTEIGDSLCKLLEMLKTVEPGHLPLLKSHVDALRAVAGADIKGDGGAIGRELTQTLHQIRIKLAAELGVDP